MVRREVDWDVSIVILCTQEAQEAKVVAVAYTVVAGVRGRVLQ
jgi:hypothetical protein